MQSEVDALLSSYESGKLSRRQLLAQVAALAAMPSIGRQAGAASTFQAVGLNHIALSVTDIPRSRDFYVQHLGLTVSRESSSSSFLTCGDNFVALFRSGEAGLNHYCYAIEGYDVDAAADKLRANNLPPRISGGRIYFDDPDGIEVQLAAPGHRA